MRRPARAGDHAGEHSARWHGERRRRDRIGLRLLLDAAPQSDGSRLAWLAWRHPQMPWDGTELWVADVTASGRSMHERRVAGGPAESIYQPGWSPDGTLYFVSDRDGWWTLYRSRRLEPADVVPVIDEPVPTDAEFGRPQWMFGTATWAFAGPSRIVVVAYTQQRPMASRRSVDVASGVLIEPRSTISSRTTGWRQRRRTRGRGRIGDDGGRGRSHRSGDRRVETLQTSSTLALADRRTSRCRRRSSFRPAGGQTAHAFFYPPRQRGLPRAARRAAAADRHQPRRADDGDEGDA